MQFLGKPLVLASGIQEPQPLNARERERLKGVTADWTLPIVSRAEEVGRKRRQAIDNLDDPVLKAALER